MIFRGGASIAQLTGQVPEQVPAEERGSAQGFLLALTFAGASAAPLVTGFVIKRQGYAAAFLVGAGVLALAGILAAALCARLRRTERTK